MLTAVCERVRDQGASCIAWPLQQWPGPRRSTACATCSRKSTDGGRRTGHRLTLKAVLTRTIELDEVEKKGG
jgi:hypothetical protein